MVSEMMFLYKNVFPLVSDWFSPAVGNIIAWHRVPELELVQYPRGLCSAREYGPRSFSTVCRSVVRSQGNSEREE